MTGLALVGVLCLVSGCYRYEPLTTASPAPGTYLSVTLSDAGSAALARSLGPDALVVHGRYLDGDAQSLRISVSSVETKGGVALSWQGEPVVLPADAVASLDTRRLAKGRTALLVGVGAGGLVVTTVAFSLFGDSSPLGLGGGRRNKQ